MNNYTIRVQITKEFEVAAETKEAALAQVRAYVKGFDCAVTTTGEPTVVGSYELLEEKK